MDTCTFQWHYQAAVNKVMANEQPPKVNVKVALLDSGGWGHYQRSFLQ